MKKTSSEIKFTPPEDNNVGKCLEEKEVSLKEIGYTKYSGHFKGEDFGYWKTFKDYQIAVLFYDFRKDGHDRFGVQIECVLDSTKYDGRMDITICNDNLTLKECEDYFEKCVNFYPNVSNHESGATIGGGEKTIKEKVENLKREIFIEQKEFDKKFKNISSELKLSEREEEYLFEYIYNDFQIKHYNGKLEFLNSKKDE